MSYTNLIHSREILRTENGFPIKLYYFVSALDGIYSDKDGIKADLLTILSENPEITKQPHLYSITFAWGYRLDDQKVKAFDIFSYKFDKPWNECNPDVNTWVFKNGVISKDREISCEAGTIVLGEEAKMRRESKNLEEFLSSPLPNIGDIGCRTFFVDPHTDSAIMTLE